MNRDDGLSVIDTTDVVTGNADLPGQGKWTPRYHERNLPVVVYPTAADLPPDPVAAMIRRNERAAIADACAGFGLGIVVGLLLAASGVFS